MRFSQARALLGAEDLNIFPELRFSDLRKPHESTLLSFFFQAFHCMRGAIAQNDPTGLAARQIVGRVATTAKQRGRSDILVVRLTKDSTA